MNSDVEGLMINNGKQGSMVMTDLYEVHEIAADDWPEAILLIKQASGNSVLCWLGHRFVSIFYRSLCELDYCCAYGAYDESGKLVGVIIGTLDQSRAYRQVVRENWFKLILAANIRVMRWSVINWFLSGLHQRLTSDKRPSKTKTETVRARLIVISVLPEVQGRNVAKKLVEKMESWFVQKNIGGPYVIYTEQSNHRANGFYKKIGASLEGSNCHHGRLINQWYKVPLL